MRSLIILVITSLGFFAGCGLWQADHSGYNIRWTRLPPPPAEVVDLLVSREFDLYVSIIDDSVLRWDGNSWEASDIPEDIEVGWTIQSQCDFAWPQFSPFSRPPSEVDECIQDEGTDAEFRNKHVYVLDDQGRIWVWELVTEGMSQFARSFLYTCCGGLAGLAVALFIRSLLPPKDYGT